MRISKKFLSTALVMTTCASMVTVPSFAAEVWTPTDMTVNIGSTQDSVSVTWYDTADTAGTLNFGGKTYTASVEAANKTGYYVNRVTVDGLTASTNYSYSITSGENTSATYDYKTTAFGDGNTFSFAAVGDPQIGASGNVETDTVGWKNALSKIQSDGTDYSFVFSLGDQVNSYYNGGDNLDEVENQYTQFLSVFDSAKTIPLATLVGNHDAGKNDSSLYVDHYTMPNVTFYGENKQGDGDYAFTYNGVQFMVLNSSNLSVAEHQAFLEDTLRKNPDAKWNVVAFHKSIYSVASHVTESDIKTLRTGLSPILNNLGIDVVLQGHDHVYARSYIMGGATGMEAQVTNTVQNVINDPDGVQYVTLNSASGSKYYKITSEAFTYTAVQNQENVQNYSKVTVSDTDFTVTTYRVTDGSEVDSFTIHKSNLSADQFTDLDKNAYYYDAVNAVVKSGLMNGTDTTVFSPAVSVNRAMAATVLYRMAGSPEVTTTSTFTDVPADSYYAKAAAWAQANGVLTGYGNNIFAPDDAMSREQMVTMLYRYAKVAGKDVTAAKDLASYTDAAQVSGWAQDAMRWAVGAGVVNGTSATTLSPSNATIRADYAVLINRFGKLS